MSYSFTLKATSKSEALAAVSSKIDEIVQQQPCHAADRAQVLAAVDAFVVLCPEPGDNEELSVAVNGYVSGEWEQGNLAKLKGVSFHVSAGVSQKLS